MKTLRFEKNTLLAWRLFVWVCCSALHRWKHNSRLCRAGLTTVKWRSVAYMMVWNFCFGSREIMYFRRELCLAPLPAIPHTCGVLSSVVEYQPSCLGHSPHSRHSHWMNMLLLLSVATTWICDWGCREKINAMMMMQDEPQNTTNVDVAQTLRLSFWNWLLLLKLNLTLSFIYVLIETVFVAGTTR